MNNKEANKDVTTQRESFTALLGQLADNSSSVVRDEIALVVQRVREKEKASRSGVLIVATGVAVGFVAFISLCAASIIELTSYMAPVMAAFVTGVVLALVGFVIAFFGYDRLKKLNHKDGR